MKILSIQKIIILLMLSTTILDNRNALKINFGIHETTLYIVSVIIFLILNIIIVGKLNITSKYSKYLLGLYLLFIISGFISIIGNVITYSNIDLAISVNILLQYIIIGLFVMIVITSVVTKYDLLEWYIKTWIYLSFIVITIAVMQILAIHSVEPFKTYFIWDNIRDSEMRIASTFRWQGSFVFYMSIVLPMLSSYYMYNNNSEKIYKVLVIVFYIIGIIAVLFSGSRTSLLIIPLSLLPIIDKKNILIITIKVIVIIMSVQIFMYYIQHYEYYAIDRVFLIINDSIRGTYLYDIRYNILRDGLILFSENPILGIGPGMFSYYLDIGSHNMFIQILVENGVIGFVTIILFIGCNIYILLKNLNNSQSKLFMFKYKYIVIGMLLGYINLIIYSFSGSAINYSFLYLYIPISLALLCKKGNEKKEAVPRVQLIQR